MKILDLLKDLVIIEILQPYIISYHIENDDISEACSNFIYAHDITSIEMSDNLSEDFEPYGYVEYNVNTKSGLFLKLKLNYEDGELNDIDYDVEDETLFKIFIEYITKIVLENIRKLILKNN